MTTFDTQTPVVVTGATGYVAGWLVKELLEAGHTVHAPVRDPDNAEKRAHLDALAENAPGTIRYFQADLLEAGSYDEAMKGCGVVFHTASPFTMAVDDPQRELIEPALEGTRNVLGSVDRTPSVRRVVLTSSVAAIYGDNIDCAGKPDGTLTEADWNNTSSAQHNPYQYSKTLAEREAWKIAHAQQRWRLVVVNPGLVMGPGINPKATSESLNIVRQMGSGKLRTGVPLIGFATVDVRDVAVAHYRAGFYPDAEGRHIVAGKNTTMLGIARTLQKDYGDRYPLPKRQVPAFLARLAAPMVGYTREFAKRNFGYRLRLDNAKSVRALNMDYRPLERTMTEFFQQMIDNGLVKQR